MTVRIPSSLNWLINKRARLLNEIIQTEKQLVEQKELHWQLLAEHVRLEEISNAKTAGIKAYIGNLNADIACIDRALSLHEIPINPKLILPKRTQSSARLFAHGSITKLIFQCLKLNQGQKCSTTTIATFVATSLSRKVVDNEFATLRLSVRKRLKTLCAEGKVIRIHLAKTCSEGSWTLAD